VTWNGGNATVTVIPAIFTGTAAATIDITMDLNCNGVIDAGEPTRTAAIAGGTASVTFPETATTAAAASGNDNVEDPTVCYLAGNARAANNTVVTLPAGGGTGSVSTVGTAGATVLAAAQAVDNVQPAFALAPAFTATFTARTTAMPATTRRSARRQQRSSTAPQLMAALAASRTTSSQ
jgi:type IV secretory pathway VirJ component